jgi:hypothetical protein
MFLKVSVGFGSVRVRVEVFGSGSGAKTCTRAGLYVEQANKN